MKPQLFRIMLLRRLRAPLPFTDRVCRCRLSLDSFGDHRASCPHSGLLAKRGFELEATLARVCRESGARVRTNVFVRDLNIVQTRPNDARRLEIVADNLPLFGGRQL